MKDSSTGVVLLVTDGSQDTALAARVAVDLCERAGADLHLVHIWQRARWMFSSPGAVLRSGTPKERARALLEEQVERIRSAGGEVEGAHLRMGHPADEIAPPAEKLGADLVVVGVRGTGARRRASTEVLRTADGLALVLLPTAKDSKTTEAGILSSDRDQQPELDFAVFALLHSRCGSAVTETRLDERHVVCWCLHCDELRVFASEFERGATEG